jgi:hypothetical protein
MRVYFESGAVRVVRGVFYGWFGVQLEATVDGHPDPEKPSAISPR